MIKPATSSTPRNALSLSTVRPMAPASSEPVVAKPESSAIITMARMSSTMRMPKMSCAKSALALPSSSSALMMMVVEEIERMAPRKTLSIRFQPNHDPS